jgi:hypothetical protein
MKGLLILFSFLLTGNTSAFECHPPGQGMLESRIRETFHISQGEQELKEWMMDSKNGEVRQKLKELDRRIKFTPQRLQREELLVESYVNFERAIQNTGRETHMPHFPAPKTTSKVFATQGALGLEIGDVDKESLDVIPKEILDKLDPKVQIRYFYPYDKFEHTVTYAGKEQPLNEALMRVQKDMEDACERRVIDNGEYRRWYNKTHGGNLGNSSRSGAQ